MHGDWIEYEYETINEPVRGNLTSKAIYLTEVRAGNKGDNAHTVVTLTSTSTKDKKTNNARYGFLTSSNKLLNKVEIAFEGEKLRSYTFDYKQGAFNTNILDKVSHIDSNDQEFASHSMDYYDDVDSKNGYKPFSSNAETWKIPIDGLDAGFVNPVSNLGVPGFSDKVSALGGSKTTSQGASFYAGVGVFNGDPITKSMTVGGSYSYSRNKTTGISALVDINGDGLPDKVYEQNGSIYYRPNISQSSDTETKYGDEIQIRGISKFSESVSNSHGGGIKAHPGYMGLTAVAGADISSTTSKTTTYFSDVNNDGLIDVVINGKVYFNHIEKDSNGNLIPTFNERSGDTPSPINGGGVIDVSDTEVDPNEQKDFIFNSPMLDVVRVWEAPFSGKIKIDGNVQLQAPASGFDPIEYEKADGVRVAIQVAGTEKWSKSIFKEDFTSYSANVTNVTINKGQKVYFRVQSGADEVSNGAYDQVKWSPTITYTDRTNLINPNGQGTALYKAEEGYIYSEENSLLQLTSAVSAEVRGIFVKPITSDNITLKVILSNNPINDDGSTNVSYAESVVYTREFLWNETHNGELLFNMNNTIGGTNLKFEIISQTNIALEKIKWLPLVNYNANGVARENKAIVSYSSFATHLIEGQVYNLAADNNIKVEPRFTGLPIAPNTDPAINGKLIMAVKSVTGLLAKKEVVITNGLITPTSIINSIAAKKGDIWVEYYIADRELFTKLGDPKVAITANGVSATLAVNTFTTRDIDGFGIVNRGWGQFIYNANEGRYGNPIAENLLKLPQSESDTIKLVTRAFLPMTINQNDKESIRWMGQNTNAFVADAIISTSRLGEQNVVLVNPLEGLGNVENATGNCIMGSGAFGVPIETKSKSIAGMVGAMGVTTSTSKGESETVTSFADMNGDGYPDIITKNKIQFTNSKGGFDGESFSGIGNHKSKSNAKSIGYGGNPVHAASVISATSKYSQAKQTGSLMRKLAEGSDKAKVAEDAAKQIESAATVSLENAKSQTKPTGSLDIPWNEDEAVETFIDINGDGLPDKILSSKQVRLNLGYGFSEAVDWDITELDGGKSLTVNAGLGVDFGASSISAGFGLSTTTASTNYSLMDLNSDGLPDKVRKDGNVIKVSFNTGSGFTDEVAWLGMEDISKSASTAESLNASFSTNVTIPIIMLKVAINPGVTASQSMNRSTYSLQDIDGDGFPEIVESDEEGKMTVYRSTIARTNKLKTVNNPLGGSFTVDYDRSQATYDHPGGKWVMKSVEINDGIHDDGANMKTVFDYESGRHERHEREFLGFGRVVTKNIDTESTETDKVYRKAIQEYDVNSVYTAGNQVRSVVKDAANKKFTESVNEYHSYKVKASADNYTYTADSDICSDRAISFTPMKYTKTVVYEGEADGMIANESYYEYYLDGNFGDLKSYVYSDKGNLGNTGTGAFNYKTAIEYTHNKNKHIFGLPSKVQVHGSDGNLYRQTEAAYDTNYANHLTKVTQTLDATNKAVMDITYDKAGNIKQKTLPANSKGQRMWYKYLYDRDYNMYVERVEDAFGYRSEMEDYDYRYGIPLTTRDMNGYTLESTIDHLGRVETITGPNEQVLGLPYTIKFAYHPQIVKDHTGIRNLAYAVTKHYDPQNPTDDLETVTFVDGFGRAIQVKKDGVITTTDTNGSNPQDKKVMLVSGRAKFDPFGRAREAFYPVSEEVGTKTTFNPIFDAITPTKTEYDIMDRALVTTLPDNAKSTMAYGKDASNRTLVTTVTDAMGGKQSTFTNGSGLTLKTEQYSGPDGTISTEFFFDPINQMLKVVDHGGNETLSTYDMAGRRTEVTHPASGTTSIKYDNASNMLSRQTANLGEEGKEITYDYDFNRLTAISYPNHPENNVKYSYGNKNAAHNRVGRLMLQEDATGAQEFFYGRLGEMNKVRRTVIIPNQAIATYVTEWKYDSWNRLEEMIYPDLEKIKYSYNTGGQLEAVKGEKAYSYNYVNKIGYDKFEQRTYLKYCNGAETNYNYDPQRRRLENLQVWAGKDSRKQIMNNTYQFDKVDNVLSVTNTAPRPTAGMGGQMSHAYTYDGLYRLKTATGSYDGAENKTASYTLAMGYDNLHNITSKKQHVEQQGIQFDGILKAGYDLAYEYNPAKPHQIATIQDDNYRTEGDESKDKITNEHAYQYDANGNLIYINTSREKEDGANDKGAKERKMLWDEENRLGAINVNGFISGYWYDAGGERVIKTSGDDEGIYVNDVFSGARTETANFTAYINPYLVVSKGGQYTKHIYIGSQRIVSKLGDLESYGQDPRRIEYAGTNVDGAKVDYAAKYKQSQQTIKDNYEYFEVDYNGKDNDDYVNGGGFCCDDNVKTRSFLPNANENPELFQYYYHADHLGSSSLITNLDGEVVQHIEYVPFGEVFIEERNNKWNTPYLFNAKELDEETGLYYYGARYYDSRASVWLSTDPLQEKYPNISTYAYTFLNPVRFVDPDGRQIGLPISPAGWGLTLWFLEHQKQVSKATNTVGAVLRAPYAAWNTGTPGGWPTSNNLSQKASNFSGQMGYGEHYAGLKNTHPSGEGTQLNAVRHTIWQALITYEHGSIASEIIANGHEYQSKITNYDNPSATIYSPNNLNDADEQIDLLNNLIGRKIGRNAIDNAPDMSTLSTLFRKAHAKQIVLDVLKVYNEEGLWEAIEVTGGYQIQRAKLSDNQYKALVKDVIQNMDENGNRTQ